MVTIAFFKPMLEDDATGIGRLITDDFVIVDSDGQPAISRCFIRSEKLRPGL